MTNSNLKKLKSNNIFFYTILILVFSFFMRIEINVLANNETVILGGETIGIKLKSKGLIVVDINEDFNEKYETNIEKLEIGDIITKINGNEILDALYFRNQLQNTNGESVILTIIRNESEKNITMTPKFDSELYKLGVYVRDTTSGVGTITYYSEDKKTFAALGHAIIDVDTGIEMKIREGFAVNADIIEIRKGEKGKPGEIRGIFENDSHAVGNINESNSFGVYGDWLKEDLISSNEVIEVGRKEDIEIGKAEIITTLYGGEKKKYDIEIKKLQDQDFANSKSMIIKIIDEELLSITGGIVQGMSGSPIIQNNRIVGAVTHVMINKPDYGYGIYIDWMINK